jgi:hypothetical protein
MANIAELFSQATVLDYVNNLPMNTMVGEQLFPARKIQSLEFEYLKAGSRIPVLAHVHAFDTEAEIGSREASKSAQELAYVKRKMQLKEKDLIALKFPRTPEEQKMIENTIYNDLDNTVNSVRARLELMRMEVLSKGTVTIKENGLNLTVDYGVPKEHKAELKDAQLWSDDGADPIADLQTWANSLDIAPTRILTSTRVRSRLLAHPAIADYFKTAGILPTVGNLNAVLEQFGLPKIAVYDSKYREADKKGILTAKRYFDDDRLVMMNDLLQGESVHGLTPDESRIVGFGTKDSMVGNVFAKVFESGQDPVGTWTLASTTMLPSFKEADNVFQAKVL